IRDARREYVRREARPAHAAHHGAGQPVAPRRVGEAPQLVPLRERDVRRGPPSETIHAVAKHNAPSRPMRWIISLARDRSCPPSPDQRRAWLWIGAGCVLFLAGQLVWSYYELIRRVTPPYPSIADVGYLSVYVCFFVAVTKLVEAEPRRRFDTELLMDTVLV